MAFDQFSPLAKRSGSLRSVSTAQISKCYGSLRSSASYSAYFIFTRPGFGFGLCPNPLAFLGFPLVRRPARSRTAMAWRLSRRAGLQWQAGSIKRMTTSLKKVCLRTFFLFYPQAYGCLLQFLFVMARKKCKVRIHWSLPHLC